MTVLVDNKEIKKDFGEIRQEQSQEALKPQEHESQPDLQPASGEVSEFMEGLDVPTPSEKVSERVSEDDKKQKGLGGKAVKSDDGDVGFGSIAPIKIPSQRIMVRRIRNELHKEIKALIKQAKIEEKKGPYYLNEILERIRELKGTLSTLATATYEVIKNLYISLFDKKGKHVK